MREKLCIESCIDTYYPNLIDDYNHAIDYCFEICDIELDETTTNIELDPNLPTKI